MIKYLGSKRKLVGVIGDITDVLMGGSSVGGTAVDLFTGTTRVAQELKRRGFYTYANDKATYSEMFGKCYIDTNRDDVTSGMMVELRDVIDHLINVGNDSLTGKTGSGGWFTQAYCHDARYFTVDNGVRIDAIRRYIEEWYTDDWKYPILLTSLIEAADRVDSTVGVQMAYLKKYAARALIPLELRVPELLAGDGYTLRSDALEALDKIANVSPGGIDVCYLDPPYNQHSYYGNYHIWESLVRWDEPDGYGVANKRLDVRDAENKSDFNSKRRAYDALKAVVRKSAQVSRNVILSYSNEGFLTYDDIYGMLSGLYGANNIAVLPIENDRYIGHKIGVYGPNGRAGGARGSEGDNKNVEYIFIAGADVERLR